MIVGELRHGQLTIIDRLKETVRLSEGLEEHGDLTEPARLRALDCLARFGERLQDMHASNVRAAGTSTLRRANDSDTFCRDAERALGHPIEVISGLEEAETLKDVEVYHAGTTKVDEHTVTAGGRVLGVTALAEDVAGARALAYRGIGAIDYDGAYSRTDIAACSPTGR